jgi:hypothetical protein
VPAAGVVETFDVPEDPHAGLLAGRQNHAIHKEREWQGLFGQGSGQNEHEPDQSKTA